MGGDQKIFPEPGSRFVTLIAPMNRRLALIDIDGISVLRDGRPVLRNVSWTIREGEFWAVAGRNGSGKSTLIQALRGEAPVSGGAIRYFFPTRRAAREPAGEICCVSFDGQRDLL